MNTVIYARYSAGPRQTDQSIEGQLRVCTDFCKQRGLTVIDTYCDRHISGRTDERPEFQRLIADAKRKKFEAVVVYKTDRFARNKYDSAVYKRELKRNGIQIFYAAEAIPDGPEGIILESLMEGLAEYYSAELAQKIKRGMHESALKCQSTGSGRPLGYRVDEQKRFQIDPESAQTVQTIFEQYIKGESNAAICELLNSRGLRTAQGKPFNKNSINRIIKNRKYIGEYRYHDIVVEGGMPAIIPKDTFNLAQAEMERRRTRKAPKSPKAEYLLAGRLFCGHCKGPMQGVSGTGKSGNKWYYYYCGNTRGKNKTCDKKQVSRDRLERAVVDFTVRYILQEEVLEELARKVHAAQERQNDTASEIAFYEKKLADNKKSIANVLRAIESGAATQTLPARLQELENEQAVILGEISFLKGKRLAFTEDQILFALMKHLEPYPGESEQDYRRRIISDFVSEVYLYDDRLLIYFNISSEDGKLKSADLSNIEGGEFDEGLVSSANKRHQLRLVPFLRLDGADENRAAIFDVQHKSISLPKVPIQQNLALKCNPAELLCGVGHLNGAKALQVAANSGGVGDDKGVLPLRERIQQFVDAVCHPGADLTEGLAVRIFEVRVFVLAFPERSVLPGRIAGAALGKAGVLPDGKPQQLCGLERTQRRGRPDERDRAESVILKDCGGPLKTFGRKAGVGAGTAALRDGMAQEKKGCHESLRLKK